MCTTNCSRLVVVNSIYIHQICINTTRCNDKFVVVPEQRTWIYFWWICHTNQHQAVTLTQTMHIVSYIRGITIHRYIDISYRKCKRYAYCIVGACIDTHDIYDPASTFQSMGENRGCWNPVRSAAFKQFKSVYYQDTILKSCQLKLLTLNLLTRCESKQLRANFINHLRVILQKNQNGGGQWRMLWQWVQSSLSKFKLSSEHGHSYLSANGSGALGPNF